MKTRKWSALFVAAMTALSLGSCEDWGQMDPPAANQTYPTLEQVASLTFDEAEGEGLPYNLFAYEEGNVPDLIADAEITGKEQNALHLDSGYVRMFNPMYGKVVQEGVSMTFFVKQYGPTEEQKALANGEEVPEGVLPYTQDVTSALFKWENENGTQSLILDNNGGLIYDGVDGDFSINLPADVKTGLLDDPTEWHYVALAVHSGGYFVYVDGKKRIDQTVTNFDMTKVGQFMANVPYLYVGYDGTNINEEWCIDEITWYRNTITSTQTTDPRKPASNDNVDWSIKVGADDCSDGFFVPKSDFFAIEPGQTFHIGFENYTAGVNNWENWVLVITDGTSHTDAAYGADKEYLVLRADNYGWGGKHDAANLSCTYNWDTFKEDMNGAYVDLTVKRDGGDVLITAITTTSNGVEYTMTHKVVVDAEQTIGAFLTLEKAHLIIHPEEVWIGESYEPGTKLVGPADCSAGWWSSFSDYYPISNKTVTFEFINNNTGTGSNWNNWLVVCATGPAGSHEYFVLRSDAYGWGDGNYNGGNITAGYNWDTYVQDMHGARCFVQLTHSGTDVEMIAKQITASGSVMPDYSFTYSGTTGNEGVFFTVELASLDMRVIGTYPYFENINK